MRNHLTLSRRYVLWRHGRGFGIHSPFAYRFVTETLRQPCAYYAYDSVGRDPTLRLAVRLVAEFRPARVGVLMADAGRVGEALKLADSRVEISPTPDGCQFLIVDCGGMDSEAIDALFARSPRPHALLTGTRHVPSLKEYGMTFSNCRGTVVVASYPHLPLQDFEVKF